MSFAVSIGLQSTILSSNLVNDIKNNLIVNASSIVPSGFVLTNESFIILAFQPNCKYTVVPHRQIRTLLYIRIYISNGC